MKTLLSLTTAAVVSGLLFGNNAHAYNRNVQVVNESEMSVLSFRASNVGTNSWGPDLLGRTTLYPGEGINLDLDDGSGYCRFDFLTIMEDGTSLVRPRVNICKVQRYTITD